MADRPESQESRPPEVWESGDNYEAYVGRWSRRAAVPFLEWLGKPAGLEWLDVGCGTGAISRTILSVAGPRRVVGVDQSEGFLRFASDSVADDRFSFRIGDAQNLPLGEDQFDVAVSGLVLNFVPDQARMVREMRRVVRPGGAVAVYIWDYAGEMQMMRHFWDAAIETNPTALNRDEGRRFPIASLTALRDLFEGEGLDAVRTSAIEIATDFKDFDDYWRPFLGRQGTAPGYVHTLEEGERARLREALRKRLPVAPDGSISLIARALAVTGAVPS